MKVSTSRFGEVEASEVLEFPEGLPGFEGKRYTVVQRPEAPAVVWLQSLSEPEVALMTVSPDDLGLEYDVSPKPAETRVIRPHDEPVESLQCRIIASADAAGRVLLNLFAPLFINADEKLAMQLPLVGSGHGVREAWPREAEI